MKYIKLFENNYYQEVDNDEVCRTMFTKDQNSPFTINEINTIKDKYLSYIVRIGPQSKGIGIEGNLFKFELYKGTDEWYYVRVFKNITKKYIKSFKCDQFEGLLKLLNDKMI